MEPQSHQMKAPRLRYIIAIALAILLIGVVFYHKVENLSWLDSLYFCVITLTTIGYGDIVPRTDAGKLFTVFYVLIGISILGAIVNYLLRRALVRRQQHVINRQKSDK